MWYLESQVTVGCEREAVKQLRAVNGVQEHLLYDFGDGVPGVAWFRSKPLSPLEETALCLRPVDLVRHGVATAWAATRAGQPEEYFGRGE